MKLCLFSSVFLESEVSIPRVRNDYFKKLFFSLDCIFFGCRSHYLHFINIILIISIIYLYECFPNVMV